jgi:hypothetical protein
LCFQAIAAGDRVAQDSDRPVHTDCLQRRAQAARDRATELVKTSEQLLAHADVLVRKADVAIAEARRLVRDGIAAGTLPRAGDAPPPFVGVTGDGSQCAAGGQAIRSPKMMMTLNHLAGAARLRAVCFEAWHAEIYRQPEPPRREISPAQVNTCNAIRRSRPHTVHGDGGAHNGDARAAIPFHAACHSMWDNERPRILDGDVITE